LKSFVEKHLSQIVFVLAIAASFGLFFSRAVLSIATVFFGLLAIWQVAFKTSKLLKNRIVLAGLFFVFWLAISFFYTSQVNRGAFFNELAFKLSFIAILMAIISVPLKQRQIHIILLVFVYSAMLVALGTFMHYVANYAEINELISQSKPIPIITGYFHISFSLMLGFSVLASFWVLFFTKGEQSGLRKFFWVPLVINTILIHVIAARTGLLAMYIAFAGAGFFYFALEKKQAIKSTILVLGMVVMAVLAISFIKPLNNRYKNTLVDLNVYINDENPNWWSGAMRLEAIENSWYIFLENPIFGVGMADLNDEVQGMYKKNGTLLLPENRVNPHNQFMNILVSGGLVAFILFIMFWAFAFVNAFSSANWLLLGLLIMFFIGFNLESFLERQFGTCFFGLALGLLSRDEFSKK